MKKVTNQILAFFLLVVLTGCSSSDGGGGGGSTAKSHSLAEGGSVQNMRAGDYWKYTGTTTYRQSSIEERYTTIYERSFASGGYTQYSSNPIIVDATTINLTYEVNGSVSQSTSADYYIKSGSVDYQIMQQGNDDLFYAVNQLNGTPEILGKSVTQGSSSSSYTLDACSFYSGYTCVSPTTVANVTLTNTLIGTETVSTSIGNFESYKIRTSLTVKSNNTDAFSNYNGSAINWYYPALGVVKQTYTVSYTDYSPSLVVESEITLNSTNNSKYSRNQRGLNLMSPFFILKLLQPIR